MRKGYTLLSIYLDGALMISNRPDVIVLKKYDCQDRIEDKLNVEGLKIVSGSDILSTRTKEELFQIMNNKNTCKYAIYSDFVAKGRIMYKLYIKRLLQGINFMLDGNLQSEISIFVDNEKEKIRIEKILNELY